MLPLLLVACAATPPGTVLAFVRDGASYEVLPREIPELTDPVAMDGTLGEVRAGGRVAAAGDGAYTGGAPVSVRWAEVDGVAVPLDEDGLLLWSFYGHLSDARAALASRGVDLSPLFPVTIAWNAAVSPLIELAPADNAAYAMGWNLFLLLPDGGDRDVPFLANAGVVTHELGHAVLHLRMTGDPLAAPLAADASGEAGQWQASLHEGFADALATLLLDDPDFLAPSVDMPDRRVDGEAVLRTADLPAEGDLSTALTYDPYVVGTVIASASWDVRVALDDPDRALALLLRGVDAWAPASADDLDGARFLDAWVAAAADDAERDAVCAAVAARFAGLLRAEGCP